MRNKCRQRRKPILTWFITVLLAFLFTYVFVPKDTEQNITNPSIQKDESLLSCMPKTDEEIKNWDTTYVIIHDNKPDFTGSELEQAKTDFETYSELDVLGRCGPAMASVSPSSMPTEKRGSIGHVKPSGWHTVKYPEVIPDNYLYNRCHLIGYQLTGQNDNPKNLITGTRYLNVEGMLPFENQIANYVTKTNNHVLYRVTPIYQDDISLVASAVTLEAMSVKDNGKSLSFAVLCPNVQPNIHIDYTTGESYQVE